MMFKFPPYHVNVLVDYREISWLILVEVLVSGTIANKRLGDGCIVLVVCDTKHDTSQRPDRRSQHDIRAASDVVSGVETRGRNP